jgi:hypothetical protein
MQKYFTEAEIKRALYKRAMKKFTKRRNEKLERIEEKQKATIYLNAQARALREARQIAYNMRKIKAINEHPTKLGAGLVADIVQNPNLKGEVRVEAAITLLRWSDGKRRRGRKAKGTR